MTHMRQRRNALPQYGRTLILAFVIALSSWAFGAPPDSKTPAATTQFEGSFDKLEVASLGGWAWDKTQPNAAIKVEIYDGKTLLATITASEFREDLKNAGKGDGKHAFNYALAATYGTANRIPFPSGSPVPLLSWLVLRRPWFSPSPSPCGSMGIGRPEEFFLACAKRRAAPAVVTI